MAIPVSVSAKGTARHMRFGEHAVKVYLPSAPHCACFLSMQTILCVSLAGLHTELAFIESKNWLNFLAMLTLLVAPSTTVVIVGAFG